MSLEGLIRLEIACLLLCKNWSTIPCCCYNYQCGTSTQHVTLPSHTQSTRRIICPNIPPQRLANVPTTSMLMSNLDHVTSFTLVPRMLHSGQLKSSSDTFTTKWQTNPRQLNPAHNSHIHTHTPHPSPPAHPQHRSPAHQHTCNTPAPHYSSPHTQLHKANTQNYSSCPPAAQSQFHHPGYHYTTSH